ncbi:NMDA receptor synaptonuclear signaling and neuronal migration factor isoform X1 [Xiphophorus maculatus]|uniref:NMDA receptor synaptonuclear signaling and neuronal migration factor isoform X1 n=1 Tax=Xiphophorus maculatus TaxID=8083 RepID=UPI000C6DA927|nr:NMDA receptor synaptonuclear signaling and neuronal migration factor isoform X1 [Xiphophorus maculatus]XP_023198687.1 NMDA receptor synaptonuclear signaling and neuronal migration factor isoform X1 [Xiphophorus maculatus]XP_023198688.1 NMDA receptor synaptonuclear signaling and neuronal migration factor isoform X1 [Xiphophorus maculatus]
MGTAVSKRKNLRSDAISSVAAKVRAARAFGEYLSNTNPENRNGADHLLSETFPGQDCDSPDVGRLHNNNLPPRSNTLPITKPSRSHQPHPRTNLQSPPQVDTLKAQGPSGPSKRRLSVERSLSSEDPPSARGSEGSAALKPPRVYTITREGGMTLGGPGSEETVELEVLKGPREHPGSQPSNPAIYSLSCTSQPAATAARGSHHRGSHHRASHHHANQQQGGPSSSSDPLQSSRSASNIGDWGIRRGGSREEYSPDCVACIRAPCQSQRSLDLDTSPRDGGKPRKKLERVYSEDRTSTDDREDGSNSWFPKENMFSFQTATTTMQAISAFRGIAERKRQKREQETATVMERNFRKHLRMVGSRRVKVQTFVDRRAKSFSRSWSDPTPVKPESIHDSRDSGELQTSSGTLDEGLDEDADWEEERGLERAACEGDDFIPPKIMLISSKVPKAEYVPNIIRRDDPSIIPILYDHEHATFDDILEEIEKKLTAYRKGCRIWNMLIFCQGGPGHLYLLKNKVATFAKVEKEDDMVQFWRRLSRLMSKLNPEPNLIHIMGCYVLGSANGEKLIQTLKRLMRPLSVEFKSPLELSAQGKEMIEMYFDFRLYRLWKSRQHSKLLDYDDLL